MEEIDIVLATASVWNWQVRPVNIVVEGISDVEYCELANKLHFAAYGTHILDDDLAVLAAGERDDGGVDGVKRRQSLLSQLAETDMIYTGVRRYRFVGLLDNDRAGRRAMDDAIQFDPRTRPGRDLFLLHHVMPALDAYDEGTIVRELRNANNTHRDLYCEIEDLINHDLIDSFLSSNKNLGNYNYRESGVYRHYDLNHGQKVQLREFVKHNADVNDLRKVISMLKAMRSYLGLAHNHIQIPF